MRQKILKVGIVCLALGAAGSALANEGVIVNQSDKPLTLTYQIVHQNPGQAVVSGPEQKVTLDKHGHISINFALQGYQLAGIVPIQLNDISLPPSARNFYAPRRCAITTSANFLEFYFCSFLLYNRFYLL